MGIFDFFNKRQEVEEYAEYVSVCWKRIHNLVSSELIIEEKKMEVKNIQNFLYKSFHNSQLKSQLYQETKLINISRSLMGCIEDIEYLKYSNLIGGKQKIESYLRLLYFNYIIAAKKEKLDELSNAFQEFNNAIIHWHTLTQKRIADPNIQSILDKYRVLTEILKKMHIKQI